MSTVVWPVIGLRAGISGVNYPIMTSEKLHQPDLAVHYPRVLLSRAEARGADPAALLKAAGIDESLLADDTARVTPAQLGALLRGIWLALDDELSGFGAAPQRFGGFALMARQMIHCETLGEALRDLPRLCPYLHLPFQSGLRFSAKARGPSI